MVNTVPKALTAGLLEFCRTISAERPVFIRSKPPADARLATCFDNVERKIERAGGSVAYGWAIWNLKGYYFEAEHHGVWCNRSGLLIDVSPQLANPRKILFLPDPSAVYDPQHRRTNIIRAEIDKPVARELVELAIARNAILTNFRFGGRTPTFHSDEAELIRLEARIREVMRNE